MPPDPLLEGAVDGPDAVEGESREDVPADDSIDGSDVEAAYRLENARLRTRVEELERELADRERARRVLLEQYERILDERGGGESRSESHSLSERIRRFVGFDRR